MKRQKTEVRNENPSKKRRVTEEPVELFSYCCYDAMEFIFQHLSAKDVKTASTVSTTWYRAIGGISFAMKKLQLKLVNPDVEKLAAVLSSPRQYSSVIISKVDAKKTESLNQFLVKISSSVTELDLSYCTTKVSTGSAIFSKIKSLRLGSSLDDKTVQALFASINETPLETLEVYRNVSVAIISYLTAHPAGLKVLDFDWGRLDYESHNIEFLFGLQLEKFTVRTAAVDYIKKSSVFSLIEQFVASQASSLKHLVLNGGCDKVWEQALDMPKLKIVEFQDPFSVLNSKKQSQTIVSTKILGYEWRNVEPLIRAIPNLKNAYIPFMHREKMKMIARTMPKLETLYCQTKYHHKIVKGYDIMKRRDKGEFNRNIQLINCDLFPGHFETIAFRDL